MENAGLLPGSVLHGYALYCKSTGVPASKYIISISYESLLKLRTRRSEDRILHDPPLSLGLSFFDNPFLLFG